MSGNTIFAAARLTTCANYLANNNRGSSDSRNVIALVENYAWNNYVLSLRSKPCSRLFE